MSPEELAQAALTTDPVSLAPKVKAPNSKVVDTQKAIKWLAPVFGISAIHVGNPDGVPGLWFQPGSVLAIGAI